MNGEQLRTARYYLTTQRQYVDYPKAALGEHTIYYPVSVLVYLNRGENTILMYHINLN